MKQRKLNNGTWEVSLKCLGGSITVTGATLEEAQAKMLKLTGGAY
ncbi:hypothetical protein PM10SUCC1_32650 [Propionigenium maris DSM 9537]|uniref:Uncharacterized protein n=1 Tax=Propionigenium maris DSM 9537 TaxID=1123000 RepID=A0A9W6LNU8_9FUSO|nr:hypothetical protein [Propionigenium maris]GLI57751.1 hypothetical protein PM10SUCC1_32650 [Propionigenium maris DSM 9537]